MRNRVRLAGLISGSLILLAGLAWVGLKSSWTLAAALGLAAAGWGVAAMFLGRARLAMRREQEASAMRERERQESARAVSAAEARRATGNRRLEATLAINQALAEAASGLLDERGLMNRALCAVTELVDALGCSFVPVDEWQQPLPPFTYGQLPPPVLSAWSTHLASGLLRERCAACQARQSAPGACPLHPAEVGAALSVYCLPLDREADGRPATHPVRDPHTGRTVGVLHLYLPAGRSLDLDDRGFLAGLLEQIALGYEAARLRDQEQATLRQLRLLRAPAGDFTTALNGLLDGLAQALAVDFVLLRLRPSADERISNLSLVRGEPRGFAGDALDCAASVALDAALAGRESASPSHQRPAWIGVPLSLPETGTPGAPSAGPLGVLLAGVDRPLAFHPRQQAILQTVAAQAALVIENERNLRALQYQAVVQERARLAREIHDGLAQTLAFLKLQTAQMQAYQAQGDAGRLGRALKEHYQALAEAYLDTRQSIDNLRLTPDDGLEDCLERSLSAFEASTGLRVERAIQPLSHPAAPEIQAQLIRIVQEALSNIRKHARARTVRLSLREWQGQQIIEIADDGLGFDAEDVPEVSRHGLRGMRERADWIGADFQIISQPHRGTTVRLSLPVTPAEEASR